MIRPALIDSNPIELNYYLFMISQDKCNGSCDVVDDINVKVFNMIIINEVINS